MKLQKSIVKYWTIHNDTKKLTNETPKNNDLLSTQCILIFLLNNIEKLTNRL